MTRFTRKSFLLAALLALAGGSGGRLIKAANIRAE